MGGAVPLVEPELSPLSASKTRKTLNDGNVNDQVTSLGQRNPIDYPDQSAIDYLDHSHWAWQRLKQTRPPEVRDASWPHSEIDRFVLAKLEATKLKPVRDADRPTLIRRVTFDLTGLLPTPEEIDAFVGDNSPEAFEKVVDRLLATPAYGERWGRHWLDVARYAESTGASRNLPFPHAWR